MALAWTTAAAAAGTAWTAVALALDAVLTFAATGAMALPALIVAGVVAGIALLGAEIYFQLTRAISHASDIGKQTGEDIKEGAVAAASDTGERIGGGIVAAMQGAATTAADAFHSAVTAIGGYFVWATGAIGSAMNWLQEVFKGLADDAKKTFGGISDALAVGDIALAAKVLWAMLKLEWQKGLTFLEGSWEGFKGFWSDAVTGLAIGFINGMAAIRTAWVSLTNFLTKTWNAWAASTFQEGLADWLAPVLAPMLGVDTEGLRKTMHEDFANRRQAQPADDAAGDAQAEAAKGQIESDRQATIDQLAKDKLGADHERQSRIDAAQADVATAKKELDDALATAHAARGNGATAGPGMPGYKPPEGLPDISNLAGAKAGVAGTFSGAALAGLGGGNAVWDKMEDHLFVIRGAQTTLIDQNKQLLAGMGDGLTVG